MKTVQGQVSQPMVERYVRKLEARKTPPAIPSGRGRYCERKPTLRCWPGFWRRTSHPAVDPAVKFHATHQVEPLNYSQST